VVHGTELRNAATSSNLGQLSGPCKHNESRPEGTILTVLNPSETSPAEFAVTHKGAAQRIVW
jgi:hypothetical protein